MIPAKLCATCSAGSRGWASNSGPTLPRTTATATEQAVRQFQEQRGLRIDGICGPQTWGSLVEAGYRLNDRLLYLRAPMLRGDDVSELQEDLGALGFDAGRVDGIFGPRTVAALEEFQRNAGLTIDGICGPDTVAALRRVVRPAGSSPPVVSVRETQRLLDAPRELLGRRVGIGETGGLAALADAVGRALVEAGAVVAVLHHPDESVQAGEANAFNAEAFLSLALCAEGRCSTAYYAARAFESIGGRQLAELVLDEVGGDVFPPAPGPRACSSPSCERRAWPPWSAKWVHLDLWSSTPPSWPRA